MDCVCCSYENQSVGVAVECIKIVPLVCVASCTALCIIVICVKFTRSYNTLQQDFVAIGKHCVMYHVMLHSTLCLFHKQPQYFIIIYCHNTLV